MNNTSVILMFEGGKRFLFPAIADRELVVRPERSQGPCGAARRLKQVNVYKWGITQPQRYS